MDLVVPVKPMRLAKSRLRASGGLADAAHRRLVLAMVRDTVAAAGAARLVRRVVAICSDREAAGVLRGDGFEVVADEPDAGLNPALRYGCALLRDADPGAAVGALQSDLPALRAAELDAALDSFAAAGAARAFCPDHAGTGSTMLLAAAGTELDPRFGAGSAAAHLDSGALALHGPWPSLRRDVDTAADLAAAAALGVGRHTGAAIDGGVVHRVGGS